MALYSKIMLLGYIINLIAITSASTAIYHAYLLHTQSHTPSPKWPDLLLLVNHGPYYVTND